MKIIGLICEYNPFHNGHIYQINKIKELYPDSLIIAIVGTNFTLRGDIAIINKWHKTEMALENKVDLVLELPTLYATQSADMFAYGALAILNKFKIDMLVFGSETDDINLLKLLANTQINNAKYDELVKAYLDNGVNYPTAMSKALYDITNFKIDKPNDLLGLSYIKEIIKNNYSIEPISIKRTNDYHGNLIEDNNIINASLIRDLFNKSKDISLYLPENEINYLYNINKDKYYDLLKYQIMINKDNLSDYLDITEGIDKRILKNISKVNSIEELIDSVKTKRYTYNKINRTLLHILLNIKKEDNIKKIYLRILGFNKRGRLYLNKIKKDIKEDIYTNYKPNKNKVFDLEFTSTYIYSILVDDKSLILDEYKKKPIIYD